MGEDNADQVIINAWNCSANHRMPLIFVMTFQLPQRNPQKDLAGSGGEFETPLGRFQSTFPKLSAA